MSQKDYPKKAKPCIGGLNCCGCGQFGPRKSKRKSRRYARRVVAQTVQKEIEEDSDWDAHVSPYGFGE